MKTTLPDPNQFFGIRFESLGGLGAHTASQILATAAVLRLGLNGAHFSTYGAEQKGSVVRSYVRLASPKKTIRSSAPIESPDVIVVFHQALLDNPATIAGIKAEGTLIYNAPKGEQPAALSRLPATTKVIRVDAQGIARKEKSEPNAALLGVLATAIPFLDVALILETLSDTLRYPEVVTANKKAFLRGAKEFEQFSNVGKVDGDLPIMRANPIWGYETAPIGGILATPGNTVSNNLAASRMGCLPIFELEKCIHCGICDMVCPDYCLVFKPAANQEIHLQGIDYRYCKGCLRCVESCSTGALRRKKEMPGLAEQQRVKLFPELEGEV